MTNIKSQKLTSKEKKFCQYYVELGNGTEAIKKAGYTYKNDNSAGVRANQILRKNKIKEEIDRLMHKELKSSVMNAQEVMELYTSIARGEVKDQFGLEASLSDRIKAINEIAKRTVDVENRKQGKADAVLQIKLDWKRDDNNA